MKEYFNPNRLMAITLVAALSLALVLALEWAGVLQRLENISEDWRMSRTRAESTLDRRVAVVLIDDASLQSLQPRLGRFPWSRQVYADLLEYFNLGGARAVVFDILFSEPEGTADAGSTAGDERLVAASADSALAYHAVQFIQDRDDRGSALPIAALPAGFVSKFGRDVDASPAGEAYNRYLIPFDGLYQVATGVGAVGLEPDADGVYRRARLFWPYAQQAYPLLGAAPVFADRSERVRFLGREMETGLQRIPVDAEGRFAFAMVSDIPAYSIGGLLQSQERLRRGEADLLVDPAEFAGRIVFVGAGAAGLQDVKATALGAKTPGVFIHASIADNLLRKDYFKPIADPVGWAFTLMLALITALGVLLPRGILLQLSTPILLASAYGLAATFWFESRIVFPLAAPMAAIATSWLFAAAYLAFTEGRDKKRVRTMLGQYVSPDVLRTVMDRYRDRITAEIGSSEELTVLFSDIRGFTGLSENLSAEQVVDLLNTHFSEMTEIVFSHQGTLDKFIGDAMMVFWGAPLPAPDHADRALQAALAMYRGLARVNQRLVEKSYPPIDIGIGLNTGAMVLGNVGSERKLDYTVVGDNVNLASRMEGLSKYYGCPIVLSEYTLAKLHEPVPCVLLDRVRVKGRNHSIRIYAPLAVIMDGDVDSARGRRLQAQVEAAFEAYLAQDWDRAQKLYSQLPLVRLKQIFVDRCIRFSSDAPMAEWDGVFTQISK